MTTTELPEVIGELRGTVADAVDWARECGEEWGTRVTARVDQPRSELPTLTGRHALHDGPTWTIHPIPPAPTEEHA